MTNELKIKALKIVIDAVPRYHAAKMYGLCIIIINEFLSNTEINKWLNALVEEAVPTKGNAFAKRRMSREGRYYWPKKRKRIRIKWLKKQIKIIENECS